MIKMISICGKSCDFYESYKNRAGCCHQQSIKTSPEDRIVDVKDKFMTMRIFTQVDEMFKRFDGGFPAWCPLAREINKEEVKNGTDDTAGI